VGCSKVCWLGFFSVDDDLPVFDYVDVVFVEEGNAVVITELADGDEGPLKVVKKVADLCCLGKGGC
jgi:hypothetical protein